MAVPKGCATSGIPSFSSVRMAFRFQRNPGRISRIWQVPLKDRCCEKDEERYHAGGRILPDGLHFLNPWVNKEKNLWFQLTESHDAAPFVLCAVR